MSTQTEWRSLRRRLESLKDSVTEEIQNYPPPIPACDAQFNRLLELRRLLPQELDRLESAASGGSLSIKDFLGSSPCQEALSKGAGES